MATVALLAGELVDPLIGDHLEPLRRVEQESGVGQGIGQTAGRVGGEGEESGAELADVPGRAVTTAGPGAIRSAQPIQHHRQARWA
jgi:hypothetical protein